jgi:hypothetical protein
MLEKMPSVSVMLYYKIPFESAYTMVVYPEKE